jgi:hypothetical protein
MSEMKAGKTENIFVLAPVITKDEATDMYLKRQRKLWMLKSQTLPDDVVLLYKPYFLFEYLLKVQIFNRKRFNNATVIVDGLSGVPALVKDNISMCASCKQSIRGKIVNLDIPLEEANKNALDLLYKITYSKYTLFPQCTLQKNKVIYRGFYQFVFDKERKSDFISADSYSLTS